MNKLHYIKLLIFLRFFSTDISLISYSLHDVIKRYSEYDFKKTKKKRKFSSSLLPMLCHTCRKWFDMSRWVCTYVGRNCENGKEIEFEIMIRKLIRKGRKTFIVNFYLLWAFYGEEYFDGKVWVVGWRFVVDDGAHFRYLKDFSLYWHLFNNFFKFGNFIFLFFSSIFKIFLKLFNIF